MIPITIALVVVQEMSSRMGAVTGKGLSDLIREEFGFRVDVPADDRADRHQFRQRRRRIRRRREQLRAVRHLEVHRRAGGGVRRCGRWSCTAPTTASRRSSSRRRRFTSATSSSGVLAHPDWKAAALSTVTRPESIGFRNYGYLSMIIGLVGTTIAPWMQFYLQASIVEKGMTARQYSASRLDVIIGCLFAAVVAWFIVVACAATLHSVGKLRHRDRRRGRGGAAAAGRRVRLPAVCRRVCSTPRCSRRAILPISTAYAVCEGLGLESGLDKRFDEAPAFYWLYTALIVFGAGVMLDSAISPVPGHGAVAGRQRRPAAVRADLRAAARSTTSELMGELHELARVQHRVVDYGGRHDRADDCHADRTDARLRTVLSAECWVLGAECGAGAGC